MTLHIARDSSILFGGGLTLGQNLTIFIPPQIIRKAALGKECKHVISLPSRSCTTKVWGN